jgi:phosphoribosylanthranilate isomerase
MARAKICGINTPDAIDAAVAAGADWVGFVFFPPSPRFVTPARARDLVNRRPDGPPRVGLFVKPSPEQVAEVLETVALDILQIYGAPEDAAALRTRFGRPVWRAVGVATATDLPAALDGVDGFVIESKPPPDATRPGGNAVSFDWTLTQGWRAPGPWLLAGGLDPSNVRDAIALSGASAVDVSSGVERTKGVKDTALIEAFIRAAHTAG